MKVLYWLLFFLLLSYSKILTAKDLVYWRVIDWPPFYILEGEYKGKGLYDEIITLLSKGMPEYTHIRKKMKNDRVRFEIKNGANVCHPSVFSTEVGTLSVVNSILLPHRLIIKKNNRILPTLTEPSSLDKLLANNNVSGGVTTNRYTIKLNKVINKHAHRDHLYNTSDYNVLIKMLLHDRIDYIIEYAPIVSYTTKLKRISNSTTSLGILENQDTPFVLVHVVCPKTDWGRMMIDKINKILITESKQANFLDSRLRWYDSSSKHLLKKYYKEEYFNDK